MPASAGSNPRRSSPVLLQNYRHSEVQQYGETASRISEARYYVGQWRKLPESSWGVIPDTARLLKYWPSPIRPHSAILLPSGGGHDRDLVDLSRAARTTATKKLVGDIGHSEPTPRTLLIDSEQLESGGALHDNFRTDVSDEIERFRCEKVARSGGQLRAEDISDREILREVMNTEGKAGRLGEPVHCVVSFSMLTEDWDANAVTHAGRPRFGTQLLCEQVIGRALRRQLYEPK